MRQLLFALLIFPTAAFADVAAAIGYKLSQGKWVAYSSEDDVNQLPDDAKEAALRKCAADGATHCRHMLYVFGGYCGAIAVPSLQRSAFRATVRDGSAGEDAVDNCKRSESVSGGETCSVLWEYCHPSKAQARKEWWDKPAPVSSNEPPSAIIVFLGIIAVVGIVLGLAKRGQEHRKATEAKAKKTTRKKKSAAPKEPATDEPATPEKAVPSQPLVAQKQAPTPVALPPKVPKLLPTNTMQLKTKRSQRNGTFGATILVLDARMEVSQDVLDNIKKYKLGKRLVYESANREKYRANAQAHLGESGSDVSIFASPGKQALGLGKTFYKLARSGISAGIAALSLKITIDSLIAGVHVECKDLDELLAAEDAIKIAGQNLKGYLSTFATFDGDEQVVEL